MNYNPEYDYEEFGDIIVWDYYVTKTTKKDIKVIYVEEEKSKI